MDALRTTWSGFKTQTKNKKINTQLGADVHAAAVLGIDDAIDVFQGRQGAVPLRVLLVAALALVELAVEVDGHREDRVGRRTGLADHIEDDATADLVEKLDRMAALSRTITSVRVCQNRAIN